MGRTTRPGTEIEDFQPDDTENKFYTSTGWFDDNVTLSELLTKIKEKWGDDVSFDDVTIRADHIHTECLGYDRYQSSDHTNFIVVERKNKTATSSETNHD